MVAPWWLLGLALLPVIYWLHRGGRHRRAVPVSHLGLWRRAAASSPAAGARRPPDPAWRRRALLAALLLAALSGPQLPWQPRRVTLWVDDSLSMLTVEAQGTRLAAGLAQARSLLAQERYAEVEVRTLGDPWRVPGDLSEATTAAIAAAAGHAPAAPPPAALLRSDRQQWLVTDGAHAALLDWPGGVHPGRIIQVAAVRRNVGLERLSARRHPDDPDRLDVLAKVTNGGDATETRELIIRDDAGERSRTSLRLDAGKSAFVTVVIPAAAMVRARLQPGDALAEDDVIALDLAPLRRRQVAVDPECPRPLREAVAAHPALILAPAHAAAVDAGLDCGSLGAADRIPTIRVRADHLPVRPQGPLRWSSAIAESQRLRLEPDRLRVAAQLRPGPGDAVWLAVGAEPVVVARAGKSSLIETALDFGAAETTRGPEVPLLVNWLFERLLGRPLLDAIALTDRGAGSSRVVPTPGVGSVATAHAPTEAGERRDASWPLLIAAALVLLWEIVALCRQWLRLTAVARAEVP